MEILLFAFAIIFGLYCAYLSSVLTSLTYDDLQELADMNNKNYEKLQKLKIHYEESTEAFFLVETFLYSIALVVFTIYISSTFQSLYALIFADIIFFFLLILLRTFIWSLGIRFSKKSMVKFSSSIISLDRISKPLNKFVNLITEKISGKEQEEASREELTALFETAHEEGSIESDEYRILKNIMHFSNVLVSDVMTPRTVIFSCKADKTVKEVVNLPELKMYSRFPIWEGESLDDGIVGYVMTRDILHAALSGKSNKQLKEFALEAHYIPESAELDTALDQFLQRRQHISIVVDEYGGIEGILTMEDVLETILGVEIVDEADKEVDMREVAKKKRDQRIKSLIEQYSNQSKN
ncbi:MAG: CBS domain-containing protein [Chlorobi bacterium]|nr:CBS domain-containing protein [Chlorobiota bacterium]